MAIDITGLTSTNVQDSSSNAQAKSVTNSATPSQSPTPANAPPTDSVTLTESAAKLQQLERNLSSVPVVDQNRVEGLRKAIAAGEYEIDPARTAEKFIQLEARLFK